MSGKRPRAESSTAESARRRKSGRVTGVQNYSAADVDKLLNVVQRILPLGPDHWERVALIYNEWAAANGRMVRATHLLRRRFIEMAKDTTPTGDPICPPPVRQAKHIQDLINARCETSEILDEDDGNASSQGEQHEGEEHEAASKKNNTSDNSSDSNGNEQMSADDSSLTTSTASAPRQDLGPSETKRRAVSIKTTVGASMLKAGQLAAGGGAADRLRYALPPLPAARTTFRRGGSYAEMDHALQDVRKLQADNQVLRLYQDQLEQANSRVSRLEDQQRDLQRRLDTLQERYDTAQRELLRNERQLIGMQNELQFLRMQQATTTVSPSSMLQTAPFLPAFSAMSPSAADLSSAHEDL